MNFVRSSPRSTYPIPKCSTSMLEAQFVMIMPSAMIAERPCDRAYASSV